MASVVYTALYSPLPGVTFPASIVFSGVVGNPASTFPFTALQSAPVPTTGPPVTLEARIPTSLVPQGPATATVSVYTASEQFGPTELAITQSSPAINIGNPNVIPSSGSAGGTTTTTSSVPSVSSSITNSVSPSGSGSGSPVSDTSSGSAPSSPTTSPQPVPPGNIGALAGAAVGCLIGGALIAGLLVWFCLRKRNRRQQRYAGNSRELSVLSGHGQAMQVNTAGSKAWERHLPQSESDETIRQNTTALFDQLEMHVENFYTDNSGALKDHGQRTAFSDVANQARVPRLAVQGLSQGARPTSAIKYAIGNLVISKIEFPTNNASASILPADLTSVQASPNTQSRPGYDQAFAQWRVLTAYLRPKRSDDAAYQEIRSQTISHTAAEICVIFEPWARSLDRRDACFKSMAGILKRASDLGILLFSQPASFRWNWGQRGTRDVLDDADVPAELAILPGLDKLSDKDGQHLAMPLRIVGARNAPWRISRS